MIINFSEQHSLVSNWVSELRDVNVQVDRLRFRRNLERIGEVAAYEISKVLPWKATEIPTPLGIHDSKVLEVQPVLATILRAGLPLHNGMLNYFDKADNAFISAYRKHHRDGSFEISLEYMSCPVLDDRIVKLRACLELVQRDPDGLDQRGGRVLQAADGYQRFASTNGGAVAAHAVNDPVLIVHNDRHESAKLIDRSFDPLHVQRGVSMDPVFHLGIGFGIHQLDVGQNGSVARPHGEQFLL